MILTPEDMGRCQAIAEIGIGLIKPIVNAVADATSIPPHVIYGRKKTKNINEARQLVYFLAHRSGMSLSDIGRAMHRDHSTIIHGVQREQSRRNAQACPQVNPPLRAGVNGVAIGD